MRYAKALDIVWEKDWQSGEQIFWDRIPANIASKLREFSKAEQKRCQYRVMPRKHKYALVRGKDRRETRQLIQTFAELNPTALALPYPKRDASARPHEAATAVAQ
jgi:hypothetical protein